eukprot:COSAG02_NODE_1711_length_11223_cov_5.622348_2_plen_46_part_00
MTEVGESHRAQQARVARLIARTDSALTDALQGQREEAEEMFEGLE